jgi:dephospho-CoA kinase
MKKIIKYLDPKVIGVTGGIGSGQSTVCAIFASLGCKVIDVDKKAKDIVDKDKTLQRELRQAFGEEIFFKDGKLNRRLLANIAFIDESKTLLLNNLVHPRMVAEVVEEMEQARFCQRYPLIVVDAALIYELSIEQIFDAIIVVFSNRKQRVERVMKRDGLKRDEILSRIRRQIPLEDKREWADFVIDNNGSLQDLQPQCQKIYDQFLETIRISKGIRV